MDEPVAEQMMLQDLEHQFCRSHTSMENYGFPPPQGVPTELEEAISHWRNDNIQARQSELLEHLNHTHPNNLEQQMGFKNIMESIINFNNANWDDIHEFHFIGGHGGMGKSALFKNCMQHAAKMAYKKRFALNQVLQLSINMATMVR